MSKQQEMEDLLDTHRKRLAALLKGDLDTLDNYVSDDLIYTSPDGRTLTKQQVFEGFRSGSAKVETMETRGTEVRLFSNAAVVTYAATTKMRDGQHETTGDIRATATYIKETSGWRLVSQHQSQIK